jgi:hypothetical protein
MPATQKKLKSQLRGAPLFYLLENKGAEPNPFKTGRRAMPDKPLCTQCRKALPVRVGLGGLKRIYGLCPDCEADLTRRLKGPVLEAYLETLDTPALVVNRDLRVIAYNLGCLRKLCGNEPNPNALLVGEFLECHNASLPEPCGATPACLDCSIRRTVFDTLRTGIPQKYIPAVITGSNGNRTVKRDFLISAEKLGDMVQITIGNLSVS